MNALRRSLVLDVLLDDDEDDVLASAPGGGPGGGGPCGPSVSLSESLLLLVTLLPWLAKRFFSSLA